MDITLGLNCYNHNSSLSLIIDGEIVWAAEEERFNRSKYSDVFPFMALTTALKQFNLSPNDIDTIAFCWDLKYGLKMRIPYLLSRFYDPITAFYVSGLDRYAKAKMMSLLPRIIRSIGLENAKFVSVPHHLSHAASSFYSSPFDSAAIISIDGVGEWETIWQGVGEGKKIRKICSTSFPNSLGFLFDAFCVYLGFRRREDAGKVMGLGAYGNPQKFHKIFNKIVKLNENGNIQIDMTFFDWHRKYVSGNMFSQKLVKELGSPKLYKNEFEQRHYDIAAALQNRFEDAMLHIAAHTAKISGKKKLCLAGGCALNCLANERIFNETSFDDIFIFPAATDAGAGLGAGLFTAIQNGAERKQINDVYIGPGYSVAEYKTALEKFNLNFTVSENVCSEIADELVAGKIIGWFQGRMEFGPRALGNRSILCNPSLHSMKDIVNTKVKHREGFRPFAPACPLDDANTFFDINHPSPWMLFGVPVKNEYKKKLPAITHEDGTARLQTVTKDENILFYNLLKSFGKKNGIPILLNTSFNIAGEPVVCSPIDAIKCFLDTGIDILVLGNFIVRK